MTAPRSLSTRRAGLRTIQSPGGRVSYMGRDFTQVAEVYAGSGYLSQSSPTVFFGVDAAADGTVVVRWHDGAQRQ
ncbi:MAG: ASPIC/UnbV domain-containing protein [Planctomycetes bacterium]|nr:ASPIC/UnbV domain-containing protein [Planctomycetota bacterium]